MVRNEGLDSGSEHAAEPIPELLHPNTVRLSVSDFQNEIPDRKQYPKHYLNCAEGFWGFRAPPESRVHSQVRLLTVHRHEVGTESFIKWV